MPVRVQKEGELVRNFKKGDPRYAKTEHLATLSTADPWKADGNEPGNLTEELSTQC